MLVLDHVHYAISPDLRVVRQRFAFDRPTEVESLVTSEGPWFKRPDLSPALTLKRPHGQGESGPSVWAPRVLVEGHIRIDDVVSSVSIQCPLGHRLSDIHPGTVHRAEVDMFIDTERTHAGPSDPRLFYLFTNPQPASPVPFNIDAELVKDKHDYLRRMQENKSRAYHSLLLRKCLAPSYQLWPDVMDYDTASIYCDVAKSTVATWVKEGRVKASPDDKTRILKKNLDAYLESR